VRIKQGIMAGVALAWLACGAGEREIYSAHGVVREVLEGDRQVVIAHEDIPGLMPAMTMNFEVPDPALLASLAPGQVIDFEVEFDGHAYRVVSAKVLSQCPAPRDAPTLGQVLDLGHPVPQLSLVDQDGRPASLEALRGRFVLVDFIYTSCPGPCPILTGVHVEVQRRLPPELRESLRLVSISLDPERDTPERLREYAKARGADLTSWSFLTGPPAAVDAALRAFGVGKSPGKDGEIDHLVVSFLIGPEGRVERRWVGLDHPPEEILADLLRMLRG
jgi:protein SCO1/2